MTRQLPPRPTDRSRLALLAGLGAASLGAACTTTRSFDQDHGIDTQRNPAPLPNRDTAGGDGGGGGGGGHSH